MLKQEHAMGNFKDKTVLVTGGSRGIGAAIVARFAGDGAKVAFTWSASPEAAAQVAAATGAHAIKADSADREAIARVIANLDPLDIAVVNAGVGLIGDPLEFDPAAVDRLIDVNIRGAWYTAVESGRRMKDDGRIIVIGSMLANGVRAPGAAAYGMTKSAMQGLTRGLARDFGPRRITVNCIQPGATDTDMNPEDGPYAAALHAQMIIPRHARAEEIASLAAFIASPAAAMITGAMLPIDGGFLA
jgi:cyclic-di-GMP-binding biofilm dispersal mediator protein